MDRTCIGMYGNKRQLNNPETTVCDRNQMFFLVDKQTEWNWSAKATDNKHIEAVCGLGKEDAVPGAQGWISREVLAGGLQKNAYSITLVPQKLALPIAREPNVPANRTNAQIMITSFLTVGGWDE